MPKSATTGFSYKSGTKVAHISLFTAVQPTLKAMGIKARVQRVDWQHIKDFSFGELGYDYEEGLRFVVAADKLREAIAYLRGLKVIPTQAIGVSLYEKAKDSNSYLMLKKADEAPIAEAAGLKWNEKQYSWSL